MNIKLLITTFPFFNDSLPIDSLRFLCGLKRLFVLCFFFVFTQHVFSQGEANNWYFGYNAGITFNTSPPSSVTNGQLHTAEGCASISDHNGNLLFYTDGVTVWNKNHQVMTNGTGLKGHKSSTQSAIIVPKPGSTTIYYIITTLAREASGTKKMCYSEVNMSLSGGLGAIVSGSKNIQMLQGSAEKVACIRHGNGIDYWIVGRKLTEATNDKSYYAFLINCSGVSTNPVKSNNVGKVKSDGRGYLVGSPNGQRIAMANHQEIKNGNTTTYTGGVEVGYFNNLTGKVSNIDSLGRPTPTDNATGDRGYGVAFSPNSQVLYASGINKSGGSGPGMIVQWNISLPNGSIAASKKVIKDGGAIYGALQLGPDGKIYVALYTTNYLDVINYPNLLDTNCGYQTKVISTQGRNPRLGLPPFISSFFEESESEIEITAGCVSDSVQFKYSGTADYTSITWNFGDGTTSTGTETSHLYASPGEYEVQLIKHATCNDTVKRTITVLPSQTPTFSSIADICQGDNSVSLPLVSLENLSGSWSGSIDADLVGVQTFTFTPSSTCAVPANLSVTVVATQTPTFSPIAAICQGDNSVSLPSVSLENLSGIWSSSIDADLVGVQTFTFTPSSTCAVPANLSVTVVATQTPTFSPIADICQGDNSVSLPSVSLENLSGSWSGSIDADLVGVQTFTFTPSLACAVPASLSVTVVATQTLTFSPIAAICQGDNSVSLPSVSLENLSGIWSGSIDADLVGVQTFTFTPSSTCAVSASLSVTVVATQTPTFSPIADICQGDNSVSLPSVSLENLSGSWSGSIDADSDLYFYSVLDMCCSCELERYGCCYPNADFFSDSCYLPGR